MSEVIIYSEKRVKGLRGKYIAPYFFERRQLKGAEKVYTDDEKIIKSCKELGIECEKLTKSKTNTKKDGGDNAKTNTKKDNNDTKAK